MLAPKESRDLKKTYKRLAIFMGFAFVIALVEGYLFWFAGLGAVLNGFLIILTLSILYLIFLFICAKIDKKREKKLENNKIKDPFSK